jgi:hypothetical protein
VLHTAPHSILAEPLVSIKIPSLEGKKPRLKAYTLHMVETSELKNRALDLQSLCLDHCCTTPLLEKAAVARLDVSLPAPLHNTLRAHTIKLGQVKKKKKKVQI